QPRKRTATLEPAGASLVDSAAATCKECRMRERRRPLSSVPACKRHPGSAAAAAAACNFHDRGVSNARQVEDTGASLSIPHCFPRPRLGQEAEGIDELHSEVWLDIDMSPGTAVGGDPVVAVTLRMIPSRALDARPIRPEDRERNYAEEARAPALLERPRHL